ncbi:MAG: universal stress protein [Rubrivivax sp.]|nr:universal stress protein [Rubrivivax sp.]
MNQTAVLAIDLSPAAEPLLECAAAGLRHWGVTRLLVTHVLRIGYGQKPGERAQQDIQDWLATRARPLRGADLSVDVEVRTAASPATGILSAAIETRADLVVIGTRSHNLASRLFLGSVARDMVRKTSVPLLLQWLEPTDHGGVPGCTVVCADPLRHVLLATDLSKHAAAAERAAVALAAIARRVDGLVVLTPKAIDATPALPLMARAAMGALLAHIEAAGGRGEALVVEGDPHEVITRVAQERDCSLIVCGKQGQHWVQSMVIGSTASRLCEMAGRPVLLVPLAPSP